MTTVTATLRLRLQPGACRVSLGADPGGAFFKVTLPLVAPGIISGGLFAFAISFDGWW